MKTRMMNMLEKNLVIKHKIPKKHEDWVADRLKGIGGSDAGAVLGLNEYKSPYTLWAEKSGLVSSTVEDNEMMRQGRDLEEYVAQRFCEATGKKVKKSTYSFQSKEHPFMLANVDRLIVGEEAGLECKTTNILTKTKYDKGDIPASYYAQCMHYMAVTGAKKWYIAIVVLSKGFYWYEIERNEDEIASLIAAEKDFWDCVTNNIQPSVDGTESTSNTISEIYPDSVYSEEENIVVDLGLCVNEMTTLNEINKQIKELEEKKKYYENVIKAEMQENERGYTDGYSVSWKTQSRTTIDSKKLAQNYPQAYADCQKVSTSRVFKFKSYEEKEGK